VVRTTVLAVAIRDSIDCKYMEYTTVIDMTAVIMVLLFRIVYCVLASSSNSAVVLVAVAVITFLP
jgi:hypothetical protein